MHAEQAVGETGQEFDAGADIELAVDVRQVSLDGAITEDQARGDLFGRHTSQGQFGHLAFAPGQTRSARPGQFVQERLGLPRDSGQGVVHGARERRLTPAAPGGTAATFSILHAW